MKVHEQFRDGTLMLTIAQKVLVRHPDWQRVAGLKRPDVAVVAVNLADVDFISSLFLQGCVELCSSLADRGVHLVLLRLSPSQRALLELIEGASALVVLEDEEQLDATVTALGRPGRSDRDQEGVTRAEKRSLWS